jgi:hypothetical protein
MSLFVSNGYGASPGGFWAFESPAPVFEPPPLLAQLPTNRPSARELRVFVIDNFGEDSVNISRPDTVRDLSHGEVVEMIIRRGLPDAQITRVNNVGTVANPSTASGALADTLDRILTEQAAAQGVARSQVDLGNFVVNLSQKDSEPMSPQTQARLTALVAEFNARGGRIYVAAGNADRNPIIDIPGVIGVDGSDAVIGRADSRTPSTLYDNGDVPNVANSVLIPFHRADGRIRPFADSPLLLPPSAESPRPPELYSGSKAARVIADPQAVGERLRKIEALHAEQRTLMTSAPEGQDLPPAAQQRADAIERELERRYAELRQLTQGKLLPLSVVPIEAGNVAYGIERVPRDIDRSKVYVDSGAFFDSFDPGAGYTLYQNVGGVIRPLTGPGEGVPSRGTSWAAPNFLVEQEVERLRRRSP